MDDVERRSPASRSVSAPEQTQAGASPLSALRSRGAWACFLLALGIGLGLDLWTKSYAWEALDGGVPHRDENGRLYVYSDTAKVIPGWLHFKLTVNQGAVFGVGQGNRWLFVAVSVLAIGVLGWLFATSGRQWFYQILLGMLLAGVLGNLYDRIVYAYVRDMIYIFPDRYLFGREVFPWIFNVADSLLCAGVVLMFGYILFKREDDPAAKPKEAGLEPAAGS